MVTVSRYASYQSKYASKHACYVNMYLIPKYRRFCIVGARGALGPAEARHGSKSWNSGPSLAVPTDTPGSTGMYVLKYQ